MASATIAGLRTGTSVVSFLMHDTLSVPVASCLGDVPVEGMVEAPQLEGRSQGKKVTLRLEDLKGFVHRT
ncbi:hypothetical protein GCM10008957_39240 [Deinococcus ruber]|uniref:Uncharacterized protein n=1 Tax=Deinococcus ruber TaxID=1848197 RepID=A0A918FCX9_9DEIO|nr:hypothetical protein GCM10008957_39240 [Deinococcus ruber]